jgi:hypothetical protein
VARVTLYQVIASVIACDVSVHHDATVAALANGANTLHSSFKPIVSEGKLLSNGFGTSEDEESLRGRRLKCWIFGGRWDRNRTCNLRF